MIANAKSLHERYHHVVGMFLNFKEIKMKVENVERLCDNQRKAAMVLIKNLQVTFNKSL